MNIHGKILDFGYRPELTSVKNDQPYRAFVNRPTQLVQMTKQGNPFVLAFEKSVETFYSLVFDQTGVDLTRTKYSDNIKQYSVPTQKQENVVDSHSFWIS